MHMTVGSPPGYEPKEDIVNRAENIARDHDCRIAVTDDVKTACRDADVLYTDVWASMGQEDQAEARKAIFAPYQLNQNLLSLADPGAIVLHCLPAHYGDEIDYRTSRTKNSAIFDQAENRLHAQKALMALVA